MNIYIGVDLHKGQFTVCFLTEQTKETKIVVYYTYNNGYEQFEKEIKRYQTANNKIEVAVESTGNARYFVSRMERLGIKCKVINTLKFKIVNQSVKKTDKHDAKTIAEFLSKDMLPESVLCSIESETIRRLLKTRTILVRTGVKIKNQLHGLLLGLGIEVARGQLQSKKKRQQILNVLAEQGLTGAAVEPLFNSIDQLNEQVKRLDESIAEMTKEDKVVKQLMSIPGIGITTGATIRAWADNIKRFETAKKFCAYAGLVPWVQNSNEHTYYGHITKRGPEELRTALVQAVMGMIRNKKLTGNYRLMNWYSTTKHNKGSGQTIIGTARKLAVIIWAMLKNEKDFDPTKMLDKKLNEIAKKMKESAKKVA
jgi:transposase